MSHPAEPTSPAIPFSQGQTPAARAHARDGSPRVTLLTYGTRGDVEPFLALAVRLRQAGLRVRLAAPESFHGMIGPYDLEFHGLPGDPQALARGLLDRAGSNVPRMVGVMTRHIQQIALEAMRVIEAACQGADCIVHSFLMTASGHLQASANRIPEVSAQLFPVFSPTAAFPGPTFPDLPLGPLYRRGTHALNALIYWQGSRLLYGWVRRQRRGLPALPAYPFSRHVRSPVPILYGFSSAVIPRPVDWGPWSVITGYWFLDPLPSWAPPEDVVRFLEDGEPPVYVGFGSMIGREWESLARQSVAALEEAGLRGLLATGSHSAFKVDLPPNILAVGDIPHAWLFPRVEAVVHHGGAGTMAAALRAGKPSLVLPLTADQAFWARCVQRLGAGPPPMRKHRLLHDLSAGLHLVREDPSIGRRAREIGEGIAREDGAGRAVEEILRLLDVHRA